MKLGPYIKLRSQLVGLALVWSSTACGIRSTLLQEEDAGAVTEDEGAQRSSTSSGGRSGTSTTPRAGRGGSSGAAGMAGSGQATAGRAARAGRGGSTERAGTGGQAAAAGSGDDKKEDEKKAEQQAGAGGEQAEQAGAGGETAEQAGAGGEQAEQAGAGGEVSGVAGMDAAGSGGAAGEQAGTGGAPAPGSLSQLTPEQVTTLCSNIDMATASLPWGDGIRGYCSRRGLAQPAMCSTLRDMCVSGPEITPVCAQTIPDCPMITITEYQRCRIDTLYRFVEDNRMITCETMPPLPEPAAVQSCDVIYDRCPAARALRVL